MMMTGGRYGDAQRRVQSLGSEQTLAVQQTLVFYTDSVPLCVANCNHNWFELQTARFFDRISCDYRGVQNRINCE